MADKIRVDQDELEKLAQSMKALSNKLSAAEARLNSITVGDNAGGNIAAGVSCTLSGVSVRVSAADVAGTLKQIARGTGKVGDRSSNLAGAVDRAATLFADLERQLAQNLDKMETAGQWQPQSGSGLGAGWIEGLVAKYFGLFKDHVPSGSEVLDFFRNSGLSDLLFPGIVETGLGLSFLTGEPDFDTKLKFSWKPSKLKIKQPDYERYKNKFGDKYNYFEDSDGKKYRGDDAKQFDYRNKVTLVQIGATGGASGSIIHGEWGGEAGNLSGKASMDGLSGEYHGTIQGGLYSYEVGPDGKTRRVISPGFNAEIGASGSIFSTEGSLEYELIDNVSVGVEGNVSVGYAEGKLSGGVGWVEGKPMLSFEASAEADLFKAGGDAYFDAFGVKGSVGGEVVVGIGAHADFGYRDGVFKMDVGASLGFGASVKVELNVGDFVDKAADVIGGGIEWIGKGASKFIGSIFG